MPTGANDPSPLLGLSRSTEAKTPSLWDAVKSWFSGKPAQRRQVKLPRPPRSVLAARTPTIVSGDEQIPPRKRAGTQ